MSVRAGINLKRTPGAVPWADESHLFGAEHKPAGGRSIRIEILQPWPLLPRVVR